VERSPKADPASESTPEQHADDLHRVIAALGGGPVDVFASSGGAVNALALVARHPGDVRTLVAHEPPLASLLPDREGALAASRAVAETYRRDGRSAGMAHFIALVSHAEPFTDDFAKQPARTRDCSGCRPWTTARGRSPAWPEHGQRTHYEPDFAALRSAGTRSSRPRGGVGGHAGPRGAIAVAERLGVEPAMFPSDHGGFLGGELRPDGEPEAFAAALRRVLDEAEAAA